jgi:hypothetical protein
LRQIAAATPFSEDFDTTASTLIFGTGIGGGIQRAVVTARGIVAGVPDLGLDKPFSSDRKAVMKP